jgi:predicted  nucleic acid-binding Zn-ribbon protein
MKPFWSWFVLAVAAAGINACDKKDVTPLPRTAWNEVQQQGRQAAVAAESAAKKERDQFVAVVENDVQQIRAKISDRRSRIAKASGKAKAASALQTAALEEELMVAEQKVVDLKSATAEKWKDLRQGMSTAIDRLKQSVQNAEKESA